MPGLDGATIATGGAHTVAIMADGTVRAWGYNGLGQLGLGDGVSTSRPTVLPTGYGAARVDAGLRYLRLDYSQYALLIAALRYNWFALDTRRATA